MTQDQYDSDQAARDSALNDAEFPDDERGLTGTDDAAYTDTDLEGQTARDVSPEDEGIPDIAQDDSPTMARAEDPEFAPLPRETAGASVDVGTTAREQAEGESLSGRLEREEPDVGSGDPDEVRAAETHDRTVPQLDQDGVSDRADSFTDSVSDDVLASAEEPTGGEGPEERALHVTDG